MTEMLSHFLLILTDVQHQKYPPEHKSTQENQNISVDTSKKVIIKLAELAFKQLMNGNILFYGEDLKECGINVREASVYSGICTEIFKEELVIRQKRVFSFVHLSIQEFLAAFFAFHSFAKIKKDSANAEDEVEESEESSEEEESPEEESLSEDDFDLMSIDEFPGNYFTSEDESMTDSEERPQNKNVLRELLEELQYKEDEVFGNEETFKDEDSYDEEEQPEVENETQEDGNIHGAALEDRSEDEEKSEDGNTPENVVDVPWSQETPVYDGYEGTSFGEETILRVNLDVLKVFPVVGRQLHHLLKSAVKKSLNSKTGHLDLFLRFLLGISLESNQKLLEDLLRHTISSSESTEKTLQYIKKNLKKRLDSPERCLNLLLCLLEMRDRSLHQEVDQYVKSGQRLSPEQGAALAYILLASEDVQEEFDLTKYNTTMKSRERLLTVVKGCKKARLSGCVFFNNFGSVTSALESKTSFLRELDLSYCLVDGVPELFQGLAHKNCKVETLKLVRCQITKKTCEGLASIQKSKHSCLKDLDISCNDLRNSGVKKLSQWLTHRNCKLERLRLASCGLTSKSCAIMSSVLQSGNSSLSELDLSFNNLVSGVIYLFQGLEHQHCKLTSFCLAYCGITVESCTALASALQSEHSQLKELDLSDNDLTDSGVEVLAAALSQSKLEMLRLSGCRISEVGCKYLASAQYSTLKELDLSYNHPGDNGIDLLQTCNLKTLNLEHNGPKMLLVDFKKYACELTLDPNTVHPQLALSEGNRKVDIVKKKQPYPDHPERFQDIPHVMCAEGLTGRCYWEVDWSFIKSSKCIISEAARGAIGVAYKSFTRKGSTLGCMLGINNMSWSLIFAGEEEGDVTSLYNSKTVYVGSNHCERVGVYLDWPAGILSFYTVSSGEHTHLHTIYDKFTEPLYPAFMFMLPHFSITLVGPS